MMHDMTATTYGVSHVWACVLLCERKSNILLQEIVIINIYTNYMYEKKSV